MRILYLSLLCVSLLPLSGFTQTSRTYHVPKAGTMISLLTLEEANSVTHLTLTGKLNAEDFKHLRDEFTNLRVLDLMNAQIKMYSGKAGTYPNNEFYAYMPNVIPAYAFATLVNDSVVKGKESLEKVILPVKTSNIDQSAFKGCHNLKICHIPKKTPPNLHAEALADSVTAIFVPAGSTDDYRKKNRWENFAFIESEPIDAVLEVGATSCLEDVTLQNGYQPGDIHILTIKGKLDATDFKYIRNYMHNIVILDISQTNAEEIPDLTFSHKKYLMYVNLPNGLQTIGQRAFSGCERLTETLILPPFVHVIGTGAFQGCSNLHKVVVTGDKTLVLGDNVFGQGIPSKLTYR